MGTITGSDVGKTYLNDRLSGKDGFSREANRNGPGNGLFHSRQRRTGSIFLEGLKNNICHIQKIPLSLLRITVPDVLLRKDGVSFYPLERIGPVHRSHRGGSSSHIPRICFYSRPIVVSTWDGMYRMKVTSIGILAARHSEY